MEGAVTEWQPILMAFMGLLSALVGALVYMTKRSSSRNDKLVERSEKMLEQRDRQITDFVDIARQAIVQCQESHNQVRRAIDAFTAFEREEKEVHDQILTQLEDQTQQLNSIANLQERTAQLLDRIVDRMTDTKKAS